MNNQEGGHRRVDFISIIQSHGVGLAYFPGSQKELGPRLLAGEDMIGAPESDLDLGVVLP